MLESPDGFQWKSKWEYGGPEILLPGQNGWSQQFKLKYKDFQRLMPGPVKAKISVALAFFRNQDAREIMAEKDEFEIAGVGRCRIDRYGSSALTCRSPLLKPKAVLMRAESIQSTCPIPLSDQEEDSSTKQSENKIFYAWERNDNDQPAEYGVNPVQTFPIYLRNQETFRSNIQICPGTPLRISFPRLVDSRRVDIELEKFDFNEYREDLMFLRLRIK